MKRRSETGGGQVELRVRRLAHARGLALPAYQTAMAAGMDLVAAVPAKRPLLLRPGERALVPTGLVIALPPGTEAQVRPRSGLAYKHGITVLNSPGTIDADYRGEIMVLLVNLGQDSYEVSRGERIAQMVVQPILQAQLRASGSLDATARGGGGFGSTGVEGGRALRGKRKSVSKPVAGRKRVPKD